MAEKKDDNGTISTDNEVSSGFTPSSHFIPEVNNPLEPLVDWTYGSVILGRGRRTHDKLGLHGTVQIGAVCEKQKAGKSLFGFKVRVDIEFPHIMFLCGKRGSGKSYSLGIFAEELAKLRSGIGTVVIDPIGTFWSLKNPNKTPSEISALTQWGLEPNGFKNILVYTPIGFYDEYKGIVDKPFSIAPSDLTAEDWCLVFDVDRFKTQGLLIGDAIEKVKEGYTAKYKNEYVNVPANPDNYSIGDITQCIESDRTLTSREEGYAQTTRRSMIARFTAASRWGIFSTKGTPISELSVPNIVTVIDVSHPKIGDAKRSLIVGIIARKILEARLSASRLEDATAMGMTVQPQESIPVTWLLIDEVHLMLPHSGKTAASDALIEYAKLGRKPGCALILATQRPAATNDDILSQVDMLIEHTLALEDDITAFRRRVPASLPSDLGKSDFIRSIPVGYALLADQKTQKRTMIVQLRPRLTHHAGRASAPVATPESTEEADSASLIETAEDEEEKKILEVIQNGRAAGDERAAELMSSEPLQPTVNISELTAPAVKDTKSKKKESEPKSSAIPDSEPEIDTKLEKESVRTSASPTLTSSSKRGVFEYDGIQYTPDKLNLGEGGLVLLRTHRTEATFELYKAISKNYHTPALSITRVHPKKISKYFDTKSGDAEMFWLSKSTGDKNIGPTNLEKLAHQLNRHIKTTLSEKNSQTGAQLKPPIAILEGLEYLVSNNDFNKVLRFIEALHEKILLNKALGILPVNPSAMDRRELEQLEREMDMCLTYLPSKPEVRISGGEPGISAVEGKEAAKPELTQQKEEEPQSLKAFKRSLSEVSKKKLMRTCDKFGLSKKGSREELYKRIIDYLDTHRPPLKSIPEKIEGKPVSEIDREFNGQFSKLEKEREKLRSEREKLLMAKLKQTHELQMTKIKHEKEGLMKIKKELELREKELIKREREFDKRLSELEKQAKRLQKVKGGTGDSHEGAGFELSEEDEVIAGEFDIQATGPLSVLPKVENEALMDLINRYSNKSLLGKKKEEVHSIQPVFLPLLKTRIKLIRGKLKRKEYEYDMLWDSITGELIIDYKNGLKRSMGLDLYYTLNQAQMKILDELSSIRAKEPADLMKAAGLTKSQATRALNKLVEAGVVEKKVDDEGKNEQYKKLHKLKLPSKPEKVQMVLPDMVSRKNTETILHKEYDLKNIKKVIEGIVPGARVVRHDFIYYPYFMVDMKKDGKKYRKLIIDAVSGIEDKKLASALS